MITRAQVRALKATVAALLAQLEALDLDAGEDSCEHPERDRSAHVATFDQPDRWLCKRCGHIGGEKAAKE